MAGYNANLILEVSPNDEEAEWWNKQILLHLSDYVLLPVGSDITIYDHETCLFEDAQITEYFGNNILGGLVVRVTIDESEWRRILVDCRQIDGYLSYEYPKVVSFRQN